MALQRGTHGRPGGHVLVRLCSVRTKTGTASNSAIAGIWADRRAATAALTAVILIVLIGMIGLAIDGTRLVMVQSRLREAVDAAALIAARDMYPNTEANTAADIQNATNLFWANFERAQANSNLGYLQTNITNVDVSMVTSNTVSVRADGFFPTTIMNIVGISQVPVSVVSQATRQVTGLELALVLDNTGSMAGWPIQSVVSAAGDLVNILYNNGTQETVPNLWISVVPFTAEVNIGANNTGWLQPGSDVTGAYMNGRWMGCVMARYDSVDPQTGLTNDFTDVPPGDAPFKPFLFPSTLNKYTVTVNKTVVSFGDDDWSPTNITESRQSTLPQNIAVGPKSWVLPDVNGDGTGRSARNREPHHRAIGRQSDGRQFSWRNVYQPGSSGRMVDTQPKMAWRGGLGRRKTAAGLQYPVYAEGYRPDD